MKYINNITDIQLGSGRAIRREFARIYKDIPLPTPPYLDNQNERSVTIFITNNNNYKEFFGSNSESWLLQRIDIDALLERPISDFLPLLEAFLKIIIPSIESQLREKLGANTEVNYSRIIDTEPKTFSMTTPLDIISTFNQLVSSEFKDRSIKAVYEEVNYNINSELNRGRNAKKILDLLCTLLNWSCTGVVSYELFIEKFPNKIITPEKFYFFIARMINFSHSAKNISNKVESHIEFILKSLHEWPDTNDVMLAHEKYKSDIGIGDELDNIALLFSKHKRLRHIDLDIEGIREFLKDKDSLNTNVRNNNPKLPDVTNDKVTFEDPYKISTLQFNGDKDLRNRLRAQLKFLNKKCNIEVARIVKLVESGLSVAEIINNSINLSSFILWENGLIPSARSLNSETDSVVDLKSPVNKGSFLQDQNIDYIEKAIRGYLKANPGLNGPQILVNFEGKDRLSATRKLEELLSKGQVRFEGLNSAPLMNALFIDTRNM